MAWYRFLICSCSLEMISSLTTSFGKILTLPTFQLLALVRLPWGGREPSWLMQYHDLCMHTCIQAWAQLPYSSASGSSSASMPIRPPASHQLSVHESARKMILPPTCRLSGEKKKKKKWCHSVERSGQSASFVMGDFSASTFNWSLWRCFLVRLI